MNRPLLMSTAFLKEAKRRIKRQSDLDATIQETLALLEADAFDPRL